MSVYLKDPKTGRLVPFSSETAPDYMMFKNSGYVPVLDAGPVGKSSQMETLPYIVPPSTQNPGIKQFYRVGTDIYESGTNRKIGATEWASAWSGKAKETSAPSSSVSPPANQTSGTKQFYRVGPDIFETGTNRKIGPTEWNSDWSGKAKETTAPGSNQQTSGSTSSSSGSSSSVSYYQDENTKKYYRTDTGAEVTTQDELSKLVDDGAKQIANPGATQTQLQSRYGKPDDPNATFQASLAIDGMITLLAVKNSVGISPSTFDSVKSQPGLMGKYIIGLAFGDYTLEDVYKDIKRLDLISKGDTSMANVSIFDAGKKKDEYASTPAGKTAFSNPMLTMPTDLKGITNQNLFKLKLFQMPDWGFKELVPTLDVNSDEFKKELDSVKDAYFEYQILASNINTDRDKIAADQAFKELQKTVSDNYGIQLSANADAAWAQIESISDTMAQRGLAGTGEANEVLDDYILQTQKKDELLRKTQVKEEEKGVADKMKLSASPAEIKKMIDEDKAKGLPQSEWRAYKYGLIPSAESLAALDVNRMMADKGITKEEAQKYHDSLLDENGNYRSSLYQTQWNTLNAPKTGLNAQMEAAKTSTLFAQNQKKADDKYYNWTTSSSTGADAFSMPPQPATAETGMGTNLDPNTSQSRIDAATGSTNNQTNNQTQNQTNNQTQNQTNNQTQNLIKTPVKQATLWDSSGKPKVVNVGSAEASQLQSQGWTLSQPKTSAPPAAKVPSVSTSTNVNSINNAASNISKTLSNPPANTSGVKTQTAVVKPNPMATLYGANGAKKAVAVGSSEASNLQSQGWGLTPGSYKAK
jgi:hypothetical protein